jgi:hypothetical protein
VQVVHHGRVPFELDPRHRLRQLQELAHAVAVVVVRDVLAPVHQRRARLAGLLAVVVRVDLALAPVHLDHRRDERDHVVADRLHERRLLHDQPVGQLHQHLGAAGLGRVHPRGEPVDRLRRLDQLLRLGFARRARVGQRREVRPRLVERLDRGLVGDREQDHVAALLGLADRPELRARRALRERLQIARQVLGVVELARLADDVAEELQGRRDLVGRRQVVDQFGRDPRVLQVLLDQLGVFLVVLLGGLGEGGQARERQHDDRVAHRLLL